MRPMSNGSPSTSTRSAMGMVSRGGSPIDGLPHPLPQRTSVNTATAKHPAWSGGRMMFD
jgi:hypothetical protein